MFAPETLDGKRKVFEETFMSPSVFSSQDEALKVLDEIRDCHPSDHGWIELAGYVEKNPNGKWCAIRHHAKYE